MGNSDCCILLISFLSGAFLTQSMNTGRYTHREMIKQSNSNFTQVGSVEWRNGSSTNPLIGLAGTVGSAVAVGDVDGDGANEVISGSFDMNETSWFNYVEQASLRIWSYSDRNFNLIKEKTWNGTNHGESYINAINIYAYNGKTLIITSGSISTGNTSTQRQNPSQADLRIWEYSSGNINLLGNATWRDYPDKNTSIECVYVGDINNDGSPEIVAAGNIEWSVEVNGNQTNYSMAELYIWKLNTDFTLSFITKQIWTDPYINSTYAQCVNVEDIDGDGNMEIVVGGGYGYVDSGGNNKTEAQITVWHFNSGSLQKIDDVKWIDTDSCGVSSIQFKDIDNDGKDEIIAGGVNKYLNIAGEISIWDYPLSQVARTQFYVDPEGAPSGAHWDCIVEKIIVDDFNNDGQYDIIATGLSKGPPAPGMSGNTFWGYIDSFVFDGSSINRVANYYWLDHAATQMLDLCYADMNNDGVKEIFNIGYYIDASGSTQYRYGKIYVWHYQSTVPEFSPIGLVFIIPIAMILILRKIKNL